MTTLILNRSMRPQLYRDKFSGFAASLAFHGFLLLAGGMILVKPVQYGVQVGSSGVELNLVAAPAEPVVKNETLPLPAAKIEDTAIPVQPAVAEAKKDQSTDTGKDQVTLRSSGGAVVEAKPEYLSNPAPHYPFKARQNGWQGLVTLRVDVNKQGQPMKLEIEHSSGYDILDQAALKAVRDWRFRPARLGNITVESSVRVPVRFDLQSRSR